MKQKFSANNYLRTVVSSQSSYSISIQITHPTYPGQPPLVGNIFSCACQILSNAFYQIYSVCLLLVGCAPALSFMRSGCKQQSVQLIAGWISVPLGSLLLSYMSSQASSFYTWHITMCWQINLWVLNGTQQDNVTHNNNAIHAEKKIPLKNRGSWDGSLQHGVEGRIWCSNKKTFIYVSHMKTQPISID